MAGGRKRGWKQSWLSRGEGDGADSLILGVHLMSGSVPASVPALVDKVSGDEGRGGKPSSSSLLGKFLNGASGWDDEG